MKEKNTTKKFQSGNSQTVRLPADFRLDTERVSIAKTATAGSPSKGEQLLAIASAFDADFIDAVTERDEQIGG